MFLRQKKDDIQKVDGLDIILFFVALFHHTLQLFIQLVINILNQFRQPIANDDNHDGDNSH